MSSDAHAALIRGLRKAGDEPQLTRALAFIFQADPGAASDFVRIALEHLEADARDLPAELRCVTEQRVAAGRVDLRFYGAGWDVIVELKISAGYGDRQIERYLGALAETGRSHLLAITRDLPFADPARDGRWLGSIQWRRLLDALRALRISDEALRSHWKILLDVLEEEGSMGFTRPDPALFAAFADMRVVSKHTDAFVEVMRAPLLRALRTALGGDAASAGLYAARRGKPVISHNRTEGITDIAFAVPARKSARVRAGLFGWQPPTRFYVTPEGGKRLVRNQAPEARAVSGKLIAAGFRDTDLRAFLELDEAVVASGRLEERVAEWAQERFAVMAAAGLFDLDMAAVDLGPAPPDEDPDAAVE